MKLDLPEWAQWLLVAAGLFLVYELYQKHQAAQLAAAAPAPAPAPLQLPAPASPEDYASAPTALGEMKTEAPAPANETKPSQAKKAAVPFGEDFWKMRQNQSQWRM